MKTCTKCGLDLPDQYFFKDKRVQSGLKASCKSCEKSRGRKKNWSKYIPILFTQKEYDQLFAKQNGECAICKRHQGNFKRALSVDHNHETNEIRGLLCPGCNKAIGWFEKFTREGSSQLDDYLRRTDLSYALRNGFANISVDKPI